MTIGRNGNRSQLRRQKLGKARKLSQSRQALLESLELRQLMTVGPQLVSIQSNDDTVVSDGQILNTSPRELVFRFDDSANIDKFTLSGIQITRSGGDGAFDRAYTSNDLGTNGAVVLDFAAAVAGQPGNGTRVTFTSVAQATSGVPVLTVGAKSVNIQLNTLAGFKTTAQNILTAFQNSPAARSVVIASILRGVPTTVVADTAPVGQTLTLTGANTPKATTNLNAGAAVQVDFTASQPGASGLNTKIVITTRNFGGPGLPNVTVVGQTINVQVNSNVNNATTLGEFVNAINSSTAATQLLTAKISSGSSVTRIGTTVANNTTITLGGLSDVNIVPGYIGLGDTPNEVIVRFAETLTDDIYRIDVLGTGVTALKGINGQGYNGGVDTSTTFELDLGVQIQSVVPQPFPIERESNGALKAPLLNIIHVYFDKGDLSQADASNPRFYQLRYTDEKITSEDDKVVYPRLVRYNPETARAELEFARNLDELFTSNGGKGAFRLRIGSTEGSEGINFAFAGPGIGSTKPLAATKPVEVNVTADPASRFDLATNLDAQWTPAATGPSAIVLTSEIKNPTPYLLDFPGADSEPGNRQIRYQQHVKGVDETGIELIEYNFQGVLGSANGSLQLNAITEDQKELVRRIVSLYESYLGVRFIETTTRGFTVAVGDMRAINPISVNGPNFPFVETGPLLSNGQMATIIDTQDFNSADQNLFGSDLFRTFARGIGNLLGLGTADEVPGLTVQSNNPVVGPGIDTELVFPGNADLVYGKYVHRPESKDIDLYQFKLPVAGKIKIEIGAERLQDASLLDSVLRLYRKTTTGWQEIATNDDYFSQDAYVSLDLGPGDYIVGVSAKGNETYDPNIEDSGLGGRSEGRYELRMDFRPPENALMREPRGVNQSEGTALDGDSDGRPGGIFDYWFIPSGPANTFYVDKAAPGTAIGNGAIATPFRTISAALQAANAAPISNRVIRIVGNGGLDGKIETPSDNLAYEIGFNRLGQAQADGTTFDVPKNVTVMVDAGAIVKLTRARIGVGSTTISVDRSSGALQVLGIPRFIDSSTGRVIVDDKNNPIEGSVYFTSINDKTLGRGANRDTAPPAPSPGDWGGIDIRNQIDAALASTTRQDKESQGLFLNSIFHGDLRYGGGQVIVDGVTQVITPVHMVDSRPTIANSLVSFSADAAMAATPNSFKESNYHDPLTQRLGAILDPITSLPRRFIADYDRVGPDIHGNRLASNSINGLFVKTRTGAASTTEVMTVSGRFDDLDIVHVVSENLVIQGSSGGATPTLVPPSSSTVGLATSKVVGLTNGLIGGSYRYRFAFIEGGLIGPASSPTPLIAVPVPSIGTEVADNQIRLSALPSLGPNQRLAIYRTTVVNGVDTDYRLIGSIDATQSDFIDQISVLGEALTLVTNSLVAPPSLSSTFTASAIPQVTTGLSAGTYAYQFRYAALDGSESASTQASLGVVVTTTGGEANGQVAIANLPVIDPSNFLRIYRAPVVGGLAGTYSLVGSVSSGNRTFVDDNKSVLPVPTTPSVGLVAPPSSVTFTASLSLLNNALTAGTYEYRFSLVSDIGESNSILAPTPVVVTTNSGVANGQVQLTNLPTIPDRQRLRIYRATVQNTGVKEFFLVTEIQGLTTSYVDTSATPGSLLDTSFMGPLKARTNGSLFVDPGSILKFKSSRIEVQNGGQLLAEGTSSRPIIMTSINDVRYGVGGTMDTSNLKDSGKDNAKAAEGNWGGLYIGQGSSGSLDHVRLSYGGGTTRVEGGFASFNPIEAHQAELRVANSRLENNASGVEDGTPIDRAGRGTNFTGAIFVRGSQPIIVDNRISGNLGAAINIDVDSLNSVYHDDSGRSSGLLGRAGSFLENQGPLVDGNQVDSNAINGMVVRGQTITTESVWDDADIVHVVLDEIISSNLYTYGGLKLISKESQSLVVKLDGVDTGFTATGRPLDISNRIGGSVSLIGAPNAPIVLTSLCDDTVGAGFASDGRPQTATLSAATKQLFCEAEAPPPPTAILDADVIVVMDESSSMAAQQAFTTQLIAQLETSFLARNIGITNGNRYGLVGYGSNANPVRAIPVGANNANFGTAIQYVTAATTNLVQAGGVEDGWAAIQYALTNYNYRPNATKFMILVTDEDRDVDSRITFNPPVTLSRAGLITSLTTQGIILQGILNTRILDPVSPALALENDSTVYTAGINGTYQTKTGGRLGTGFGTTQTDYVDLVFPTNGLVGDLGFIAPGGNDTRSFANALVETIVQQVQPPQAAEPVGDWRGLLYQTNSNDRNIGSVAEFESPRQNDVGRNDLPANSQYLGILSNSTTGGDENARLGYQIQGVINKASDRDVYSFNAVGGTEIWLDIDKTQNSLDSVVELVDSDGRILALSDDSFVEEQDPSLLYQANLLSNSVNPLRKSSRELFPSDSRNQPKDLYSTNTKDAGMRVVLPGPTDQTSLYHIRVRSSNSAGLNNAMRLARLVDDASIDKGLSRGSYQLQLRLTEADEFPGSSVSFADIRFATTGVDLAGVPRHSPLLGETAELPDTIDRTVTPPRVTNPNDVFATAQDLGNLLTTDRATLSLAGSLSSPTDVDWYRFSLNYDLLSTNLAQYFSTVLDIDYADGIGRPDTSIYLYDANGSLINFGLSSNILDDRAGPLSGADNTDLGRGTSGSLDPFIGSLELRAGTYYVAITSQGNIPLSLLSGNNGSSANPLLRTQPSSNGQWIVEDRVDSQGGSTGASPIVPNFLPATSATPFTLGDVALYLNQDVGSSSNILIANPKTGNITNAIGGSGQDFQDIAIRPNGDLRGFAVQNPLVGGDADNLIDYYHINDGTGLSTSIGESDIQTRDLNPAPQPKGFVLSDSDVGVLFNAITFANFGNEVGIAVGDRLSRTPASLTGIQPGRNLPGDPDTRGQNVIYQFDPNSGAAVSTGRNLFNTANGAAPDSILGNGTDVQERGYIETNPPLTATTNVLVFPEATEVTGLATTNLLNDGDSFTINFAGSTVRFELNFGPEFRLNLSPETGPYLQDGDQFTMVTPNGTRQVFEIQTNGTPVAQNARPVTYRTNMTNTDFAVALQQAMDLVVGTYTITGAIPVQISVDGERINFGGNLNIDPIVANVGIGRVVTLSGNASGNITPGSAPILLLANDFASDSVNGAGATIAGIAGKVANAINALSLPGISASFNGTRVTVNGGTVSGVTGGVRRVGLAPGGIITGVATFPNGAIYAVSDAGGLFLVDNPGLAERTDQVGVYVTTSTALTGLQFTGLAAGPRNVEGGKYADMLFATTRQGDIVAFNARGELQPVFAGGASRISTGRTGLNGLAFSNLDYNLWHTTTQRALDLGHGRPGTPDGVVPATTSDTGNQSWYFGFEGPTQNGVTLTGAADISAQNTPPRFGTGPVVDTYNFTGGALGLLESQPISLANVVAADRPNFYFTYYSTTENVLATDSVSRDVLRVQVMGDSGAWQTVAVNDVRNSPNLLNNSAAQTSWRQARIDLAPFVGNRELRFRFQFSTGDGIGAFRGPELRTVAGSQLIDGSTFVLNGRTFEIDMGASVTIPEGAAIQNNSTILVGNTTFVFFDGTGVVPAGQVVQFDRNQSATQVAQTLAKTISDALLPAPEQGVSVVTAIAVGNRVQVTGGATLSGTSTFASTSISGTPGVSVGRYRIPITQDMTAAQVATVLQGVLRTSLAGGSDVYPRNGEFITLSGLTVTNPGPFTFTTPTVNNNSRATANNFEGIYLDDFVIGFAERGEGVNDPSQDTTFVSNPNAITNSINVGPYQLEIRGGEEYIQPTTTNGTYNDSFTANERLSTGTTIQLTSSDNIVNGDYIDIGDGVRSLRFVFRNTSLNNGPLAIGEIAVPFTTSVVDSATRITAPESSSVIASRLRDLINSPAIQSQLKITAISINGLTSGLGGPTLALSSNAIVKPKDVSPRTAITTVQVNRRIGDSNTKREQGQIVIENSRIASSTGFGVRLRADDRTPGTQNPNPGAVRNTIVLNNAKLAPGAVLINNELIGNERGGIEVVGDAGATTTIAAPIPFARIINNTIVGGKLSNALVPEILEVGTDSSNKIVFSAGTRAFADDVVSYNPTFSGGPGPIVGSGYDLPTNALGAPNYNANRIDIADQGAVSLGNGGRLVVSFTDNVLTLSGTSAPDLAVFVVGADERVRVEVSQDNTIFYAVGEVNGIVQTIDLDAAPAIRNILNATPGFFDSGFSFVRLTDVLNDGAATGVDVGADIDAIGAISTRYSRVDFIPGGTGISVGPNASPTLLNNIIVNTNVGIGIDALSSSTVVGGTLYQQNTVNDQVAGQNQSVGRFPTVVNKDVDLFLDPVAGLFYPRANSPAIDSAIDSVLDRDPLLAVKRPLGLDPSPIIAPAFDINGLLRVDDPTVSTPTGRGGSVFKDIGAQDRSDLIGPAVVLTGPEDNDTERLDTNSAIGTVELKRTSLKFFDIRLIDSSLPEVTSTGIGINASSVLSPVIRVFKDSQRLIDGVDYRFGYDSSAGVIRLTPIGGVWSTESRYTIKFLTSDQFVIPLKPIVNLVDGATYTIKSVNTNVGAEPVETKFELDLGYRLIVPTTAGGTDVKIIDGEYFLLSDGGQTVLFEFDNDGIVSSNAISIPFAFQDTSSQVATKIVAAIRSSTLNVKANAIRLNDPEVLDAQLGVQVIGDNVTLTNSLTDQQTGTTTVTSGLTIIGANGIRPLSGAIRVPLDAGSPEDVESLAVQLKNAIQNANINGLIVNTFGRDVEIENVLSVEVVQGDLVGPLQDRAGNSVQANQSDGTTQLFISFTDSIDYGDAPQPLYSTSKVNNGPRHRIADGFYLGLGVSAEGDALPAGTDTLDDGIAFPATFVKGYSTSITVTAAGISADRMGYLNAWIDYNRDGVFADSERITNLGGRLLVNGNSNNLQVTIPGDVTPGTMNARFRYSSVATLGPLGEAADGEVEDYVITVGNNAYQNPTNQFDVNNDTFVSPIDVLQVINYLNRNPGQISTQLPINPTTPVPPYVDVNGDSFVTPLDVLLVINELNLRSRARSAGGEGESVSADTWVSSSAQVPSQSIVPASPNFASPPVQSLPAQNQPVQSSASNLVSQSVSQSSGQSTDSEAASGSVVASVDNLWAASSSGAVDWLDEIDSSLGSLSNNETSNSQTVDGLFARLEGFGS